MVALLADKAAREIGGAKRELGFAGEDDIAGGVSKAGNKRVGLVLAESRSGRLEARGGEEVDIREGLNGLLDGGVI